MYLHGASFKTCYVDSPSYTGRACRFVNIHGLSGVAEWPLKFFMYHMSKGRNQNIVGQKIFKGVVQIAATWR